MRNLKHILEVFSLISGLKVNLSKSSITGIGVEKGSLSFVANISGAEWTRGL